MYVCMYKIGQLTQIDSVATHSTQINDLGDLPSN